MSLHTGASVAWAELVHAPAHRSTELAPLPLRLLEVLHVPPEGEFGLFALPCLDKGSDPDQDADRIQWTKDVISGAKQVIPTDSKEAYDGRGYERLGERLKKSKVDCDLRSSGQTRGVVEALGWGVFVRCSPGGLLTASLTLAV